MSSVLLVLGMFAVTYLPRVLPFYAMRRRPEGWVRRFFDALPVAAMAALVFPDALGAVDGELLPAVFGLAAAAGTAWFVRGLVLPLLAAVGVVALYLLV
jgi:branched-subunit amino acid transport protein